MREPTKPRQRLLLGKLRHWKAARIPVPKSAVSPVWKLADGRLLTTIRYLSRELKWAPETTKKQLMALHRDGFVRVELSQRGAAISVSGKT